MLLQTFFLVCRGCWRYFLALTPIGEFLALVHRLVLRVLGQLGGLVRLQWVVGLVVKVSLLRMGQDRG